MPIVVDAETHRHLLDNPGIELDIDVARSIVTLPDGSSASFPLDGFARHCLLEGIDQLGYLRQQLDAILKLRRDTTLDALITLLPGDGIGPEVTAAAHRVLKRIAERHGHAFTFDVHLIGGAAIDTTGDPLPPQTVASCRDSDAVLLGAVGGPKWTGGAVRPEQGLLQLRADARRVCEPASCAGHRRTRRRVAAETGDHHRRRSARGPRTDRWHLLRREDARRRVGV